MKKALVYCRVSSDKQVQAGHGLESQEKRCHDYAKAAGYKVVKTYREEGVTGGLFERPAMKKLLRYLEDNQTKHPDDKIVVIFDDLKRFARDTEVHFGLKKEIYGRNGTVECPNFKFEDTPEGKFVETVLAATAELERNQNARQVRQKMKARMELGYWSLRAVPRGLKYTHSSVHGKILVHDKPLSTIFKETIEAYRDDKLNNPEEVRKFIQQKYREHHISRKISLNGVRGILTELLYTGYIEYRRWEITRRKAKHEGFITLETYEKVQDKLFKRYKPMIKKSNNPDFPLKPFIICYECENSFTAGWCKGRHDHYPKYWCKNRRFHGRTETIAKDTIEKEFLSLLKKSKPSVDILNLFPDYLLEKWNKRMNDYTKYRRGVENRLIQLQLKMEGLTHLIATKASENEFGLVKLYEDQLKNLHKETESLKLELNKKQYTTEQFKTATNYVINILKEPVKMWKSEEYTDKVTIFNMYFDEKLKYKPKEGFKTAILSLPVAIMNDSIAFQNPSVDKLDKSLNQIEQYIWRWYYALNKLNPTR